MIDHNLSQLGLNETLEGEQVIPSEKGNLHVPCNLRQFIIQSNRNYSVDVLEFFEDNEGLHLKDHLDDVDSDDITSIDYPFFHLKFVAQPETSIHHFVSTQGDELFNFLLQTFGKSNIRFARGNRGAFVGRFTKETDPDYGDVIVSDILISTSIFYNDYRVTANYPVTQNELELVVGDIYQAINNQFPTLKVELTFNVVNDDVDQDIS